MDFLLEFLDIEFKHFLTDLVWFEILSVLSKLFFRRYKLESFLLHNGGNKVKPKKNGG